ncbi:GMC family oxidoreductase N-terminal domain-containing protein [Saccharicrinis sp. GN24d3]|uniref:GMC family oxidoreductase N-terminal domain-containing protein n=1 Tax=Saccharicrinis sp. GN24d3 TaxID=3458416 RepID=UPI0040372429
MNRLSKPITELKSEYEVIVIGSGYGGSIAASRMSRLNKKVCLLEKGKEFLPGEFPDKLLEAGKEMQINKGKTDIGDNNGLYEFVIGKDISVFKGCGLGGTSLVNANVSIEAEERVFDDSLWPIAIRNNMDTLKEGIAVAWDMLKPVPYPEGKNGYPVLAKTEGMRKSAAAMQENFRLLDINVTFENKVNHVGIKQCKCINCGDCVTGCNHGAKNTTAMNYLPDAVNHGAQIFTEIGVSHIERNENKWLVYCNLYNTGREKFDAPPLVISADSVFVCAGSLGSTEILFRSAEKGLDVSDMLGKRFSGNGDVLGFGYNNDVKINGIGLGEKTGNNKPECNEGGDKKIFKVGPCITSVIDIRNKEELEEGMTLEEGTVPAPIKSIMIPALTSLSRLVGRDTDRGFTDYIKEKWREFLSWIGGAYRGAINHTQVYLVMTHDSGDGEMELKNDHLKINWKGVGKDEIFKKVSNKLKEATKALGGNYIKNPSWTKLMNYDLVTVHPLGGCIMGDDASSGVVDHKGQVFKGKSGNTLHPGLFVMDGAILPRPVGTNPLLTISGMAERNCKLIAHDMNRQIPYGFEMLEVKANMPIKQGVQFTETMKGYFSLDEKEDYEEAFKLGKQQDSTFEFTLTIRSEDVESFLSDPDHLAGMLGTMEAPKLSAYPLMAYRGEFNLFVADPSSSEKKKMIYNAILKSKEGKTYYFSGYKEIENNDSVDVWLDTTTLFITIYNGKDNSGKVLGKGKLKIEMADFVKQLTTMRPVNVEKGKSGIGSVSSFGKFFAANIWDTFVKGGLK